MTYHHLKVTEKVKEEKVLKILTPNKLLTRCLVLIAQIKAVDNSYKIKIKKIRKILYALYLQNRMTKKNYNSLIKSSK